MSFGKRGALSPAEVGRRVSVLRRVELFSAASAEELEGLARALRERDVARGVEVVREGRLPTHVFVIEKGRFEVVSRGDRGGEPRVVNVLGEGEHFGEIGLIEGMPATATVRAQSPSTVAEIPGHAFLSFVDRSASLTDVSDRIAVWLARTHPSYRPTARAAAVAPPAGRVTDLIKDWDEGDVRELEGALLRLQALDPDQRRRQIHEWGS